MITLDGPFQAYDYTADPEGEALDGLHYLIDKKSYEANSGVLSGYRIQPACLPRVWAGDSAENPGWTRALCFPDQETAEEVLGTLEG